MDAGDRAINVNDFLTNNDEIFYYFNPELKSGIENLKEDEIDALLNRKLMTSEGKDKIVIELVKRNHTHPMVKAFLAIDSNNVDTITKFNDMLKGQGLLVDDVGSRDVTFEHFNDEEQIFSVYNDLGRGYNDEHFDEDDLEHYSPQVYEEMQKRYLSDLEVDFLSHHVDLDGFLGYLDRIGRPYVEDRGELFINLIKDAEKSGEVDSHIKYVVLNAKSEAKGEAEDTMKNKSRDIFNYDYKTINKNIYLLFLIRYDDNGIEDFKDFINKTFEMAVEYHDIFEEIDDLARAGENIDIDKMTEVFENFAEGVIESFIDEYEYEIIKYKHSLGDDEDKAYADEMDDDMKMDASYSEFYENLESFIYMHTGKRDLQQSDEFKGFKISLEDINIPKKMIHIDFTDKQTDEYFSGMVHFSDLQKYVGYTKHSKAFYEKFDRILDYLGADRKMGEDTFENELVKLKLDYKSVNYTNHTIDMSMIIKSSGKVLNGTVKIDTLPSHFQNYKLFESYVQYFKNNKNPRII